MQRLDFGRRKMGALMLHVCEAQTAPACPSELILSDRLIALALEAERAGFRALAAQLVQLACDDFEAAGTRH